MWIFRDFLLPGSVSFGLGPGGRNEMDPYKQHNFYTDGINVETSCVQNYNQ